MKKILLSVLSLLLLSLMSCSSLQRDVIVSSGDSDLDKRSEILLQKLLIIDGEYYANNKSLNTDSNLNTSVTKLAKSIQSEIDANPQNRQFLATLYGMLGRLNLLQGKTVQAESLYSMGKNLQQGDPQVIILGIRLQKTIEQREQMLLSVVKQSDDKGPLLVEEALLSYEKKNYASAVASFDAAFLKVSQSYRKAYQKIRSQAWDLKDSTSSGSADVLEFVNSKSLTTEDMIKIVDTQTNVFESIKSTKNYSSSKLFSLIEDLGLLSPVVETAGLSKNQYKLKNPVNRVLVARFLWNIYVWQNGNSIDSRKYSKRYEKKGNSPIKDVPLSSGDFDAVVGNVQLEVMELPDGVNFYPQDKVLSREFLQWVKNLESLL